MNPDDKYRITKDTSGRKSTSVEKSVSHTEHTATKAMYEAYIKSIKESHEKILESLQTEHAGEITALKNQSAIDITTIKAELDHERHIAAAKEEAAVAEGQRKAQAQSADLTDSLRSKIGDLETQLEKLEVDRKLGLEKGAEDARRLTAHAARLQGQIKTLQSAHANEIREMEGKLALGPNSWIQIGFRGSWTRKTRIHWFRYTTTIRAAATELKIKHPGQYKFWRRGGKGAKCDPDKTLGELGVEDGEEIWLGT